MTMELLAASSDHSGIFAILSLILMSALAVSLLFHRLRQSLLVGYFLCGVLIGPAGFRVVTDMEIISAMANVGVVLLMFTLGIEFSIRELIHLRRTALQGGGVQLAGVVAITFAAALLLGMRWNVALLVGFVVGMSSTVVAMKVFQDLGQITAPGGRIALGIAIFQDIFLILFMILLPAIFAKGGGGAVVLSLLAALGKGILFLLLAWLLSRSIVPLVLKLVSRTRSRELFTLMVLGLCAGVGYLGSVFGLGVALGAFVAGLVVSESFYSHRIMADVLPFKDFFLTVFFVSVGMMIDRDVFLANWIVFLGGTAAILLVKFAVAYCAGRLCGYPVRPAVTAAIALSSIGEFSLVLLARGSDLMPIVEQTRQFFLVSATLSMAAVPILIPLGPRLARLLESWKIFPAGTRAPEGMTSSAIGELEDHAIICGYGPVGQNVNRVLRKAGVPTIVIDLNADTIHRLREEGQLCLFADVSQSETLPLARVESARILALTFPLPDATRVAISRAREMKPDISILCRAKFPKEVEIFQKMEVEGIVHDELESSFEMIRRSLEIYGTDSEDIEESVRQVRHESGLRGSRS